MRAKKVEFKRGVDPKEALNIGNKKLRDFKRAIDADFYFMSLTPVMELLQEGAIGDKEINYLIKEGFTKFAEEAKNHYGGEKLIWMSDFFADNNIFWNAQNETLYIIFRPKNLMRIGKFQTRIAESKSLHSNGNAYKVVSESFFIDGKETGIMESNFFQKDDEVFTLKFVIKQISENYWNTLRNIED